LRADGHAVALERDGDGPIDVGPVDARRHRSRSMVARVGCPYGLPTPAEAIAMAGSVAVTNVSVVAVRLPWCAT
jgi:hypothetical protein